MQPLQSLDTIKHIRVICLCCSDRKELWGYRFKVATDDSMESCQVKLLRLVCD
jgi:hypothetical protein